MVNVVTESIFVLYTNNTENDITSNIYFTMKYLEHILNIIITQIYTYIHILEIYNMIQCDIMGICTWGWRNLTVSCTSFLYFLFQYGIQNI